MIEKKLRIDRFQPKRNEETGYYSFGVKIENKEFFYLLTNPDQKESIEIYDNNFSSAYVLVDEEDLTKKYVLFSTNGISVFEDNWNKRFDFKLNKNSIKYQNLEKLEKTKNFDSIEKIFLSIIKS